MIRRPSACTILKGACFTAIRIYFFTPSCCFTPQGDLITVFRTSPFATPWITYVGPGIISNHHNPHASDCWILVGNLSGEHSSVRFVVGLLILRGLTLTENHFKVIELCFNQSQWGLIDDGHVLGDTPTLERWHFAILSQCCRAVVPASGCFIA